MLNEVEADTIICVLPRPFPQSPKRRQRIVQFHVNFARIQYRAEIVLEPMKTDAFCRHFADL